MSSAYLCNLVLPGAAKSGTTSLHAALATHPHVCGSHPKEPQFFAFDERYRQGPDLHDSHFERREGVRYFLESSQCYFTQAKAIERIAADLHQPRAILLLRHPVERVLSQHRYDVRRGTTKATLASRIAASGSSAEYAYDGGHDWFMEVSGLVANSRYATWVPRWIDALGAGNVLTLRFEDFVADQAAVVRRCLDFLGLDPTLAPTTPVLENATNQTYRVTVPRVARWAARLVPQALRSNEAYARWRTELMRRMSPVARPVSAADRATLDEMLASDVAFFQALR